MPLMSWWVIKRAKLLITQLLVKSTRLEAERVKPSRVTVTLKRACFGPSYQLSSNAAAAEICVDLKIFDERPSAIGFPRQTGHDRSCVADEHAERAPRWMAGPSAFVKVLRCVRKNLQRHLFRLIFDHQLVMLRGRSLGVV